VANKKRPGQHRRPNPRAQLARRDSPFDSPDVRSTSFWSYVRDDDTALFGKIGDLRDDLRRIYKLMTGDSIEIFMDRDDIGWGQQWDQVIHRGITRTVFMLPIVTPSYFRSDACRDELLRFNSLCSQRGLSELILPVVFTGLERISVESDDEVVRIVAGTQREDFSDVWPYERGGQEWMLGVRQLVRGLIRAEQRIDERLLELLDSTPAATPSGTDPDEIPDSELGMAEYIAAIIPATESAAASLQVAVERFEEFVDTLVATPLGGDNAGSQNPRAFQAQIAVTANAIKDSAAELESTGSTALEQVAEADKLISGMYQSLSSMHDTSFLTEFRASMGDATPVRSAVDMMNEMIRQLSDVERLSSVLRKELRPARRGMQFIRDAGRLYLGWVSE